MLHFQHLMIILQWYQQLLCQQNLDLIIDNQQNSYNQIYVLNYQLVLSTIDKELHLLLNKKIFDNNHYHVVFVY